MNTIFATEDCLRPKLRWSSTSSGVLQAVLMYALQLRQDFCEVFILCDLQGCSITETASILGVSAETVISKLKQARRQMDSVVTRLCEPSQEN